jgi:hypothetical protein
LRGNREEEPPKDICLENGVFGTLDPVSGESSSIADSLTAELGSDDPVVEMEARRSRGKNGPPEGAMGEPLRPRVEMDMRRREGVGTGAVVEVVLFAVLLVEVVVVVLVGEIVEEGGEGFWRCAVPGVPLEVLPRGPKMAEKVELEKEPRRRSGVGVGVSSVIVVVGGLCGCVGGG